MQDARDVTRSILEWISNVVPGMPVAATALADDAPTRGVKVRLLSISPKRLIQVAAQHSQALRLDYVITVRLEDPLEEHRSLGELCLAAMTDPSLELDDQQQAPEMLTRLGLAPSAGLLVRKHLTREPEPRSVGRVRIPLDVRLGELGQIEGVVLGPQDRPVSGARVGVAGEATETTTDAQGRFRLNAAADATGLRLVARAHGANCEALKADHGPTILRLPLET